MFGADFGEKCIIMQFLGVEKDGKVLSTQRRGEKRVESLEWRVGGYPQDRKNWWTEMLIKW
jgi:hypothetical protein